MTSTRNWADDKLHASAALPRIINPSHERLSESHSESCKMWRKKKICFLLPGIESLFLGRWPLSLVAVVSHSNQTPVLCTLCYINHSHRYSRITDSGQHPLQSLHSPADEKVPNYTAVMSLSYEKKMDSGFLRTGWWDVWLQGERK
jgi:hypothetical protein